METDTQKPEGIVEKIYTYVCCNQLCQDICENCKQVILPAQKKRLSKSDIQHIIQQQPVSIIRNESLMRSDTSSHHTVCDTASDTSRGSSVTEYSQTSLSSLASGRDRRDSDNSRTGSISSSPDFRKGNSTPFIDMKPIEFWAAREAVQPRTPKRRLNSEGEFSIENFNFDLYESVDKVDEPLTDQEKCAKFRLGQVHFGLQYEIPSKTLMVKLIEAKDLPPPMCQDTSKQDMAHSNPYAKVSLLPDQKNSQQTSVQRKTQTPIWGETFEFELPFKEVQRRTLEVTVKDFDKYSRHCVIGQVHLTLDNINLIKGGHMWKPLLPCTKETPDLGEILMSLNYLPSAGRLNVDVIKAKQLIQTDLVGGSDPFVKVTLTHGQKVLKNRKTSVKKNTIDPVFNESVSFNLTPEQLESSSLVISVWDYNSKSRDDFVGRIVLGKQATGQYEVTHWNRMLQCQRSPVAQWHTLRTRQECDHISNVSAAVP